jgi:hypothetical protein
MSLRRTVALAASTLSLVLTVGSAGTAQAVGHHPARAGHHTTYLALTGGATKLALNPGTAQALADNGISVAPVSEARATSAGIAFPIQGGLINTKTLGGTITHSGGLMFSAGGKDLTIRDFTVNTRKKTLSAYVDEVGSRLTILDLKLGHIKVTVGKKRTTISNVKAVLSDGAASALNAYYSTSLFEGGLKIGTATVRAHSRLVRG